MKTYWKENINISRKRKDAHWRQIISDNNAFLYINIFFNNPY